jgi:hypothetical protein
MKGAWVTLSDATTKRRPPSAVHERLIYNIPARSPFSRSLPPAQIIWRLCENIKGEHGGETSALRAIWNRQKEPHSTKCGQRVYHPAAFRNIIFECVSNSRTLRRREYSSVQLFLFFFSFRLCGDDSWPNMSLGKWFAWTSVLAWSIHISLEKSNIFFAEFSRWIVAKISFNFHPEHKRSLVRKNMCWCNIFPALFFYYQSIAAVWDDSSAPFVLETKSTILLVDHWFSLTFGILNVEKYWRHHQELIRSFRRHDNPLFFKSSNDRRKKIILIIRRIDWISVCVTRGKNISIHLFSFLNGHTWCSMYDANSRACVCGPPMPLRH